MPMRRLFVAIAVAAVALLGVLPAVALADGPDVSGTVIAQDGTPAADAKVTVVAGGDMVLATTTDSTGAWAVTAGIAAGQTLDISAEGPTAKSSPDAEGCIIESTWTGRIQVQVAELPLAPVTVTLDSLRTGSICSGAATAGPLATPPATDAPGATARHSDRGLLFVAAGLFALTVVSVGAGRRTKRR
jgi:hypothetical protein